MRVEALVSVSEIYKAFQLTWTSVKGATKDIEMKARIVGVASQIERFDFFFEAERFDVLLIVYH